MWPLSCINLEYSTQCFRCVSFLLYSMFLSYSLLHSYCWAQYLAHSRCWINIEYLNKAHYLASYLGTPLRKQSITIPWAFQSSPFLLPLFSSLPLLSTPIGAVEVKSLAFSRLARYSYGINMLFYKWMPLKTFIFLYPFFNIPNVWDRSFSLNIAL